MRECKRLIPKTHEIFDIAYEEFDDDFLINRAYDKIRSKIDVQTFPLERAVILYTTDKARP